MKILISLIALSYCFVSSAEDLEGIRVTGSCERQVQPDRVSVDVGVETLKETVKESTTEANKKYNEYLSKVKKLGLKDSQYSTLTYSTSPYRVYEDKKQKLKGYRTEIVLKVETSEIDRSGEVIKLAGDMGLENIQGPRPFVSNSLYKSAYQECLVSASKDARSKAKTLAKSLGVGLGKAFLVIEKPAQEGPMPRPYMSMAKSRGAESAPQIEFSKEKIKVEVEAGFEVD